MTPEGEMRERYQYGWKDPRSMSREELTRDYYDNKVRRAEEVIPALWWLTKLMAWVLIASWLWGLTGTADAREPYGSRTTTPETTISVGPSTSSVAVTQGEIEATGGAGGAGGAGGTSALAIDFPAQAPNIGLGLSYPTASCRGAVTGGLSVAGGGIGFGTAPLDEECRIVETARFLFNIGQAQAGYMLLCQAESMHLVFNRPDHTSRREGRTVPDPESCLAHMMQYNGITPENFEDMQSTIDGQRENMDDMRYEIIMLQEDLERANEATARCQSELVDCLSK